MWKISYYWLPLFAWMAMIFYLSSRSQFPVEMPTWAFEGDKVVHLGFYGILGFLFFRAWIYGDWLQFSLKNSFITVIFNAFYGMTDEFHQFFVPGRDCSIFDWMADTTGGILACLLIHHYWKQLQLQPTLITTTQK